MRYFSLAVILVTTAGCATQYPTQEAVARRHAANVAAAAIADYKVVTKNDRTMFCPSRAPIGSHLLTCLTEREWEQEQMFAFNWVVFNASVPPFTVTTRAGY